MSVTYKTYFNILTFAPNSYWLWFVLAFNAGCINLGAFLASNRFVTHITGYATYVGEELSIGNFNRAILLFSVPAFFILGSSISAIFTDRYRLKQVPPRFTTVFFMIFCILLFVSIMGPKGIFGTFGSSIDFLPNYFLLCLLAMASGMQNGMISTATGLLVRTTHLTGISTDLGVGIVRWISNSSNDEEKIKEFKTNILRIGTITSFILGSMFSSLFFRNFEYYGFFIPTLIIGILTVYNLKNKILHKVASQ